MSKPATDIRLQRSADGFTQVIGRGNAHIITKNPTTGKCAYDGQVGGGWHYGAGLETDTAWLPGTAPWNWQMTKALYNVYALSKFSSGQIIKWVDPTSGQYVAFQPMALQWTNSLNQIQQISMPQSVAAQVNDDILYWPAGYGTGRHFKYVASPTRLNKLLIIDSAASLPSTSYDTLELNFIMGMSAGVTPYIDSGSGLAAWDKKTQKDTVKAIEFRLSGGVVVWSFAGPTAYDSSGTIEGSITGSMRLKKRGNSLYVSVRFPKSWIDSAIFPIVLDPTVDYQVGAGANDGSWGYGAPYGIFSNSRSTVSFGSGVSDYPYCSFFLFTGVTFPVDATISVAYMSFYRDDYSGDNPTCKLYFEDAANPSAVSSDSNGNGRVFTTNCIDVLSGSSWWNTNSIIDIIEELKSYDYSAGKNMQCFVLSPTPLSVGTSDQRTYEAGASYAAKLHIEYTEAASGASVGLIGYGLCGNSPLVGQVLS